MTSTNSTLILLRTAIAEGHWSHVWELAASSDAENDTLVWDYLEHHMGDDWCLAHQTFPKRPKKRPLRHYLNQRPTDLRGANLANMNLKYGHFVGCDLRGARLQHSDLSDNDLCNADLRGANLDHTQLNFTLYNQHTQWDPHNIPDLSKLVPIGPNTVKTAVPSSGLIPLIRRDLTQRDLSHSTFRRVTFTQSDLSYADLSHSTFTHCDLQSARLEQTNFSHCTLRNTSISVGGNRSNWSNATLHTVNMVYAWLQDAKLDKAVIQHASLFNARFQQASFVGARLSECDLRAATLQSADLSGAVFHSCNFSQSILTDACVHGTNLETAIFQRTALEGVRYDQHTLWPPRFNPLVHGAIYEETS